MQIIFLDKVWTINTNNNIEVYNTQYLQLPLDSKRGVS